MHGHCSLSQKYDFYVWHNLFIVNNAHALNSKAELFFFFCLSIHHCPALSTNINELSQQTMEAKWVLCNSDSISIPAWD